MTVREMTALAILRSGRSYGEAMEASKLTLDHVKAIWARGKP